MPASPLSSTALLQVYLCYFCLYTSIVSQSYFGFAVPFPPHFFFLFLKQVCVFEWILNVFHCHRPEKFKFLVMAAHSGSSSSVPSLPPPCPKSPPEYPDLYGKRRELAKVQVLEREISFLEVGCYFFIIIFFYQQK